MSSRTLLAVSVMLGLATGLTAQELGPDTRLLSDLTMQLPSVSIDPLGRATVHYTDVTAFDDSGFATLVSSRLQLLAPDLTPRRPVLTVGVRSGCLPWGNAVATHARTGRLVVAWLEACRAGQGRVLVQGFLPSGQPLGPALSVDDRQFPEHELVGLHVDSSGGFLLQWTAWRVDEEGYEHDRATFARVFQASGRPRGPSFILPAQPACLSASGEFLDVLATRSETGRWGLTLERRRADGTRMGDGVLLLEESELGARAVACRPTGDRLVVAWTRPDRTILARVFAADGMPVGETAEVDAAWTPSLHVAPVRGGFLLTWDGAPDILGRWLDAHGTPVGASFRINAEGGEHHWSALASAGNEVVVAWMEATDVITSQHLMHDLHVRRLVPPWSTRLSR